jgi:hypothetical protein
MPLVRDQRDQLARALRWARLNGWQHDVYPNTWRSADSETHVRFDSDSGELFVDRMTLSAEPLRCRVAIVPVDSPELALDVLVALGCLPVDLAPKYAPPWVSDYSGQHAAPEPARAKCVRWYNREKHLDHLWQLADDFVRCVGWPDDPRMHAGLGVECWLCAGPCLIDEHSDQLDSPAMFADAGQAFADLVDGRVSAGRASEVLSQLAQQGLIVSVAYHEESISGPADLMDGVAEIFTENEQ